MKLIRNVISFIAFYAVSLLAYGVLVSMLRAVAKQCS